MRTMNGLLIAMMLVSPVLAQEGEAPEMSPEMAAMMEAWQKAATPGPHHEFIASFAGEWVFTTKYWMDPTAPPQESKGSMTSKVIFDGRYVIDKVESEMMGQPFKGMGITGYDNVLGKYVSVWVDSTGTGIMTSEGTYDPETKTMTMIGTYSDPLTGGPKQARMVTHMETDRHVMEFFEAGPDGAEIRTMEMVYTRK
jgi:hypothetical protein